MKQRKSGLKILVVSGDVSLIEKLADTCGKLNHEVQSTGDEMQAICLAEMIYFDVGIIDCKIAARNEAELIWRLSETLPSMKIILLEPECPEKEGGELNRLAKKNVFCKIKEPIQEGKICCLLEKACGLLAD